MSPIVSERYDFVIGVDTHAATHTYSLVAGRTGAVLDRAVFPTTTVGLLRAQDWMDRRAPSETTLVVLEGTGSFGATLTQRLQAAGRQVVEAAKASERELRGTGKSDERDAVRIARAVLGLMVNDLRTPRALSADEAGVAMRVLVVAREEMTGERTRAVNALTAPVRTIDLGIDARKPLSARQVKTIAGWRRRDEEAATSTRRHEEVHLALRIRTFDSDLATNRVDIADLICQDTSLLLELRGAGVVVAATDASIAH